jgi:DNA-binding transcriptional LysR family regulator
MESFRRINIPMEILRSVVAVAGTGSQSKAANLVGLSQPALSAHLKKIEALVGGSIFKKAASGSIPTDLGKLVIVQARRIIDSNDQLLRLRGDAEVSRSIRLGISNLYAETLFAKKPAIDFTLTAIVADHSAAILTSLLEGFVDIALVLVIAEASLDVSIRTINEREVPLAWLRSPDFVVSPGAPIPILTWPGMVTEEIMSRALEEASMIYRISFSSPDYHATLAAGRAGTGLLVLPETLQIPGLIHATEYYLPPLKPLKLILCERGDIAAKHKDNLLAFLSQAFFGSAR